MTESVARTARRLNHRKDGACVFLGENNRCRIHARYGAEAKPLACRLYPFVLVPTGERWRVGLRFACGTAGLHHAVKPVHRHCQPRGVADLLCDQLRIHRWIIAESDRPK